MFIGKFSFIDLRYNKLTRFESTTFERILHQMNDMTFQIYGSKLLAFCV